jgi:MHS family proline/betaine transporter-like MFS transporter
VGSVVIFLRELLTTVNLDFNESYWHAIPMIEKKNMYKAIRVAAIGNILEQYDFSLYAYFSTVFATLFFPNIDPNAGTLAVFAIFAVGLLMRPIGGILFGYLGDTFGRKDALFFSLMFMAVPTILIGLLPTYNQIGIWAPALLTLLRMFQGLPVGGEYANSIVYLTENAPVNRRGFAGSFALVGTGIGWLFASLTGGLLLTFFSTEAVHSYAWRIPFLLGGTTAIFGLILRLKAKETIEFTALKEAGKLSPHPVWETLKEQKKKMLTIIGFNLVSTIGGYLIYAYLPSFMNKVIHMPMADALFINTIGLTLFIFLIPLAGFLADRVGSKKVFLAGSAAFFLFSYPLFALLSYGTFISSLSAMILFTVIIALYHGPLPGFMAESFPSKIRASSVSIAYNFASSLFAGTGPLVAAFLVQYTGSSFSPAYYLILAALISFITILSQANVALYRPSRA